MGGHLDVAGIVQLKPVYEEVPQGGKAPGPLPQAHEAQGVGELLKGEEGLGKGGLEVGRHQEVGLPHPKAPIQIDPLGPGETGPEEAFGPVVDPASETLLGQGLGGVAGVWMVTVKGGPLEAGRGDEAL